MTAHARKPHIDTCNACGKLFPRIGPRLCSGCVVDEHNRYELVRQYVIEHELSSIFELARETGISVADVRRYVERGRLIEVDAHLTACSCGGMGERCTFCRARLANVFNEAAAHERDHRRDSA